MGELPKLIPELCDPKSRLEDEQSISVVSLLLINLDWGNNDMQNNKTHKIKKNSFILLTPKI